jgi:predicted house-cleaning noncanonical NTP pyrophosphatase (MazG superfamily)
MSEKRNSTFQQSVDDNLIRHRSVLDIMTKLQESNARLNRAIVKAATSCGCISIKSTSMFVPEGITTYREMKNHMDDHIDGELCEICGEAIETELGRCMFYFSALLNTFNFDLEKIMDKEQSRIEAMGTLHLS